MSLIALSMCIEPKIAYIPYVRYYTPLTLSCHVCIGTDVLWSRSHVFDTQGECLITTQSIVCNMSRTTIVLLDIPESAIVFNLVHIRLHL